MSRAVSRRPSSKAKGRRRAGSRENAAIMDKINQDLSNFGKRIDGQSVPLTGSLF